MRLPEEPCVHSPLINIGSELIWETAMSILSRLAHPSQTSGRMGTGVSVALLTGTRLTAPWFPAEPGLVSGPLLQRPTSAYPHPPWSERRRWSTAHPTSRAGPSRHGSTYRTSRASKDRCRLRTIRGSCESYACKATWPHSLQHSPRRLRGWFFAQFVCSRRPALRSPCQCVRSPRG